MCAKKCFWRYVWFGSSKIKLGVYHPRKKKRKKRKGEKSRYFGIHANRHISVHTPFVGMQMKMHISIHILYRQLDWILELLSRCIGHYQCVYQTAHVVPTVASASTQFVPGEHLLCIFWYVVTESMVSISQNISDYSKIIDTFWAWGLSWINQKTHTHTCKSLCGRCCVRFAPKGFFGDTRIKTKIWRYSCLHTNMHILFYFVSLPGRPIPAIFWDSRM